MNGVEQRTHTRATDVLEARLQTVETVLEGLILHVNQLTDAVEADVRAVKTVLDGLRAELDAAGDVLHVVHDAQTAAGTRQETLQRTIAHLAGRDIDLRDRTLVGRLRWLWSGR